MGQSAKAAGSDGSMVSRMLVFVVHVQALSPCSGSCITTVLAVQGAEAAGSCCSYGADVALCQLSPSNELLGIEWLPCKTGWGCGEGADLAASVAVLQGLLEIR